MKLAILGAGAWGTALAIAFARHHQVTLWARDANQVAELAANRVNRRYLPDCPFPDALAIRGTAARHPRRRTHPHRHADGRAASHAAGADRPVLATAAAAMGLQGLRSRLQPAAAPSGGRGTAGQPPLRRAVRPQLRARSGSGLAGGGGHRLRRRSLRPPSGARSAQPAAAPVRQCRPGGGGSGRRGQERDGHRHRRGRRPGIRHERPRR